MSDISKIISEVETLPVEERTKVVDSILRTLNPPDPEIDKKWSEVAQKRLNELRSGQVQPVDGEEVFAKVRKQFDK